MLAAVCPGSFDPFTNGHLYIVEQAAARCDSLLVLVTVNPNKAGMFGVDERVDLIEQAVAHLPNVTVDRWQGLLVDCLRERSIDTIIKGVRDAADIGYETPMAHMNRDLADVQTFFMLTDPRWVHVSSSLVKEVAKLGGRYEPYLPEVVAQAVARRLRE